MAWGLFWGVVCQQPPFKRYLMGRKSQLSSLLSSASQEGGAGMALHRFAAYSGLCQLFCFEIACVPAPCSLLSPTLTLMSLVVVASGSSSIMPSAAV